MNRTKITLKAAPLAKILLMPLTNGGYIEYNTGTQHLIVTEDNVRFITLASSKEGVKRIAAGLLEVIGNV